jgi:hypothetical protein
MPEKRINTLIMREIRGFILKFAHDQYPHGITLALIEALLPPWGYLVTQTEIRKALAHLLEHRYVETRDVQLPAVTNSAMQIYLTARGFAYYEGRCGDDAAIVIPAEHV